MLDVKELEDGTVIFYTDKPRYGALRAGMEVIMKPQGDDLYKLTMAYASRGEGKLPNQTTIFEDYLEIGKKRPDGTTDKYVILKLDPKSKEKRDNFKCTK